MQHTLLSVFDRRADAQQAMDALLAAGFGRADVALSEGDPAGQAAHAATGAAAADDHSIAGNIMHFFTDLFGTERSEAGRLYADAVTRGHYVLTLTAQSERDIERGADIVERFGPVNIDEKHQQWRASELRASEQARQHAGSGSMQKAETGVIPAAQQALEKGKRAGVRIYRRVMAGLTGEGAESEAPERRAQERPTMVDPADVPAFQEEIVVEKEVMLRRDPLDELSADEEQYFRQHWSNHFGTEGGEYDEYEPAYRYGVYMRRSTVYQGQPWDEVEADLRTSWEHSYPQSAWERFKAAIRAGWERIKS
jgi:hypothetical protein